MPVGMITLLGPTHILCGLTVVVCACRHDHPVGSHTYIVWVDCGRLCL